MCARMVTGAIEAPKRLEDLHVRRDLVASLLLRTLAFADQLTGSALEQRLGLPFETFSPLIDEFEKNQLMDTRGVSNDPTLEGRPYPVKMNYAISAAGRQRASEMSSVQTRYLGPCPVNHKVAEGEQPIDRRLVKVERPVVTAGGELKLQQLDLTYDLQNRYYEAPLQWKANAGVLVIDDFGRQEVPPMRLLNRFIVPM